MMKNRFFTIFLFIVLFSGSLSALTVTAEFDNTDPLLDPMETEIETQVAGKLAKFSSMPDFAKGFGNANTYASHAATLRGYQGYSIFAVAIGSMVSIQAPNEDPLFFAKLQSDLDSGDVYAGTALTTWAIHGGINLSFIIEGLYCSFKYGALTYSTNVFGLLSEKIDFDSKVVGGFINYDISREKSILSRILVWRGVTAGTGLIYSGSTIKYSKALDPITGISVAIPGPNTITADIDPSIEFALKTENYIVPVEIYTSIRIMYLVNLGVGGGIDFVSAGKTDLNLISDGGAEIITDTTPGAPFVGEKAAISVDASTKGVKSDWYRTKLMTNVGFSAGPVFIDIPLTYYFTDNGYAVGLSAGMVW